LDEIEESGFFEPLEGGAK